LFHAAASSNVHIPKHYMHSLFPTFRLCSPVTICRSKQYYASFVRMGFSVCNICKHTLKISKGKFRKQTTSIKTFLHKLNISVKTDPFMADYFPEHNEALRRKGIWRVEVYV